MRITRDLLLKLCRETVEKRFQPDPNITAVFLTGSLRDENLPLRPITDIDLLVITKDAPLREREIVKLSAEVHFDLRFEPASLYAQPRELRRDPWRGWTMWDPLLLHEKGRFFEYTQAILRSQFDDPVNILARARALAEPARAAWTAMQLESAPSLTNYPQALENTANAVAALSGVPLTVRRLLDDFPARAEAAGRPEWTEHLQALCGAASISAESLQQWLPAWRQTYQEQARAEEFHPTRLAYFSSAIEAGIGGLWPMLISWNALAEPNDPAWMEAQRALGLDAAGLELRLNGLDALLDELEESLEAYARLNGV